MLINYNGESKVIKRICELLNTMSNVNFEVVAELPTVDISTSTIYLVPKSTAGQDNIYDEYINTDGTSAGWELIGDTEVDLSNYYTKTESDGRYVQPSSLSTVATTGDYDDLIDKPSIPANGELMTEDLDTVKTPGFYYGKRDNTCAHKPSNVAQFGLIVIRTAGTNNYYKQILFQPTGTIQQRTDTNANGWSAWTEIKTTDTTYTASGLVSIDANNNITTSAEANVQSDWSQSDNTADDYIKNKPTIPTVNDATLTLQKDGTDITGGTFTANASSNKTINIDTTDKVDWITNGKIGAKNFIPYPFQTTTKTENNVTFTDNGDGTITVNTSAPASADTTFYFATRSNEKTRIPLKADSYKVSGCPSGGSDSTYHLYFNSYKQGTSTSAGGVIDTGSGGDITYSNDAYVGCYIKIMQGTECSNLLFKPMLRLASDIDDTWQPYSMTNQELTKKKANDIDKVDWITNGNIGAKNLLPYPYYQTTQTVNGVTVTDLGDGSLDFNNTSTSAGVKIILVANDTTKAIPLKKTKYKFTWGNTTAPRMDFTLIKQDDTTQTVTGDDGYIDLDNTDGTYKGVYYIRLRTSGSASFNHKVIYPMMRYATDSDETWQPYAMTNKELTDKKANKWKYLGDNTNPPTINKSDYDELCFVFDIVWGTTEHEIVSVVYPTDAYPTLGGWDTAKFSVRSGLHDSVCCVCNIVESGGVITLSNFGVWKDYSTISSYTLDSCKIYGR